jgi:hypothetical protein
MTEVQKQKVRDVQIFVTVGHDYSLSLRFNGTLTNHARTVDVSEDQIAGDIADAPAVSGTLMCHFRSHVLVNKAVNCSFSQQFHFCYPSVN